MDTTISSSLQAFPWWSNNQSYSKRTKMVKTYINKTIIKVFRKHLYITAFTNKYVSDAAPVSNFIPIEWYIHMSCTMRFHKQDGWWLDGFTSFNSISTILGCWEGDYEGLCVMKHHLYLNRISPPAGPKIGTLWFKVSSTNHMDMGKLHCDRRISSLSTLTGFCRKQT